MPKTAFIAGVTGQDGAYLSRALIDKGYHVVGGTRDTSEENLWRLRELDVRDEVDLVTFELIDETNIRETLEEIRPDEIYNLAAQSSVSSSFERPIYTNEVNAMGTLRLLEAVRLMGLGARFYQASSSEMFGESSQERSETTAFHPKSPYGISKVFGHWCAVNYRESYGVHSSSGILFNHESPLRDPKYVTRKISLGFARIREGKQESIQLGNLDAQRDWGYADDYVEAMWKMLQEEEGGTYVISTGETHSVRDFTEAVAEFHGIDLEWRGEGIDEVGIDRRTGNDVVTVNPEFFRPSDIEAVSGDAAKAGRQLKWSPTHGFKDIARMMAKADLDRVRGEGNYLGGE